MYPDNEVNVYMLQWTQQSLKSHWKLQIQKNSDFQSESI